MKKIINPGTEKKTITLIDNIVYTKVKDYEGNDLELKMSIMLQNGNSEMRLAAGADDPKEDHSPKPCLVWIPGGGWRGTDKNLMLGEMSEFVNAGYVVASIYYRSTYQGCFPSQFLDVRTAIRFLRANAEKYEIDPDRIGTFGRSAGGHLAAFTATNTEQFTEGEWQGYSSDVQCAIDMFGPVDIGANMDREAPMLKDPKFRWHHIEETHGGAFVGGDPATMRERADYATPMTYITKEKMAPIQIFHGGNDPLVPAEINSDHLYEKLESLGLENQTEYYLIPHAGHGSREFFQDSVKELMIQFFDKYLKK